MFYNMLKFECILMQVTISNTSVLGQTCGLCGTTDGILLFSDGTTTANFMNMTEVNAFANSYLVEPRNQFLHTQRRECGESERSCD